jgi:hypothetical protein
MQTGGGWGGRLANCELAKKDTTLKMSFDLMLLPAKALDIICDKLSEKYPRSRVMLSNTCKFFKHELWNATAFFESIKSSKPKVLKRCHRPLRYRSGQRTREDVRRDVYIISTHVFMGSSSQIHLECELQPKHPPLSRLITINSSEPPVKWRVSKLRLSFGGGATKFQGIVYLDDDQIEYKPNIDEYVQPILSWLHKMLFFNKDVRSILAVHPNVFKWPGNNYGVELLDFVAS